MKGETRKPKASRMKNTKTLLPAVRPESAAEVRRRTQARKRPISVNNRKALRLYKKFSRPNPHERAI